MMLTRKQVAGALRYNEGKIKSLDGAAELSWPWSGVGPQSFVWVTALFQSQNNLEVDGKFGKKTLAEIVKSAEDTSTGVLVGDQSSDTKCSNAVIVNGARICLPARFLEAGLTASNYLDDKEPRFKHRKRSSKLIHFVLHETVGNTAQGCKNTLLRKGYGVQLILDPSGHLSCHGDLVLDRMVHANQINDTSFGVEVVNPYNPIYVADENVWTKSIPRKWWTWVPSLKVKGKIDAGINRLLRRKGLTNVPRRYVTPTSEQTAALRLLVPWLCEIMGVPYRFPTKSLNKKKRKIDGLTMKPKGRPGAGVVEHSSFSSHSDGRFILEDLLERQ